jgi:membrane fusion protein, multidrug efflux system
VIDAAPYQAAVERADAALASANTQAVLAGQDLVRAKDLIRTGAIPKQLLDQRTSNKQVADAAIKLAKAELKQATINLAYARVKAPISGAAGRAELTLGNLVQAGPNAPVLTTIVSNAGIYADFDVDEQTYLRAVKQRSANTDADMMVPVELHLKSDATKIYRGSIHAFDNRIDTKTGTIRGRALFDNADGVLVPGMYATVRMGALSPEESLMVPEKAISTDQDRKFVYVVVDGKAAYRPVQLGASVDGNRVVISGLNAGDKVVVDGIQHIRPDAAVDAKEEAVSAPPAAEPAFIKDTTKDAPAAK